MIRAFLYIFITLMFSSCMEIPRGMEEDITIGDKALFVINQGNFMYGNASLSFYDPESQSFENEIFIRSNGVNLGDVAHSMTIHNGKGYVVVNNSGIIFIIDIDNCRIEGAISNLTSPRFIYFINSTKAYISDLYAGKISIYDSSEKRIVGEISTEPYKSSENMVSYKDKLFVSCWSGCNKILVIDTNRDEVIDEIEVEMEPNSMVIDKNGKLWVLCSNSPSLFKIDCESFQIEESLYFEDGKYPHNLSINNSGDTLYYINHYICKMDINSTDIHSNQFITSEGKIFFALGIDHSNGDIYLSDAIDYVQNGIIYRFSNMGEPIDTLRGGIIPGYFCFKTNN